MSLFKRSTRRLFWLSINIVLNIIAASVIALYQDTLEKAIVLAVFLPIISDYNRNGHVRVFLCVKLCFPHASKANRIATAF
jgi:hypothetical protein